MIPFGTDTVTLIQRAESKDKDGRTQVRFERHVLTGCSWRRTERRTRYNETLEHGETVTCRIPADLTRPRSGDYLFLGKVEIPTGDFKSPNGATATAQSEGLRRGAAVGVFNSAVELSQALEAHRDAGAFIVTSVKDNARPGSPLPHWAAIGE